MRFSSVAFSLLPVAICASSAFGQITSGDLAGTVKDASGAVIPNATIRVTSESTGVTATIGSTASGAFQPAICCQTNTTLRYRLLAFRLTR
jgi:hypothetical protein